MTIRIILTLAVNYNWPIKWLDVSNAFLHGSLTEQVFMEQPQGFVDTRHLDYVCRLHIAIYGLKQAPRAWYNRLPSCLLDIGFITSLVDTSLFTYHYGDIKIFMLIYVDDIIVTGTHLEFNNSLISRLQLEFPLKDIGPLSFFLGIQATRTEHGLHFCQAKYIVDLLTRFHMIRAKAAKSPCPSGSKHSRYNGESLLDPSEYCHVVGSLQYCTLTRPEISFAVNQLCQHLHSPTSTHWTYAK